MESGLNGILVKCLAHEEIHQAVGYYSHDITIFPRDWNSSSRHLLGNILKHPISLCLWLQNPILSEGGMCISLLRAKLRLGSTPELSLEALLHIQS